MICSNFCPNARTSPKIPQFFRPININDIDIIEFSGVVDNILPSNIRYDYLIFCLRKLPNIYKSHTAYKRYGLFQTLISEFVSFSNTDFRDYQSRLV